VRNSELWTPEVGADLLSVEWRAVEIHVDVGIDGLGTVREDFLQRSLPRRPVQTEFFWVRLVLQVEVQVRRMRQDYLHV